MTGYTQRQLELDEKMRALGRPVPPIATWTGGTLPTLSRHVGKRHEAWLADCAAWERDNPQAAVDWHELRDQYRLEDEVLESKKWSEDDWGYQRLLRLGAPQTAVDAIRRQLDDRECFRETRDWMLSGKWSLVLCGPPGSGKTTAATWAAHQLVMRRFKPHWIRCPAVASGALFGLEAEIAKQKCRVADVLVLDDIGAGAVELQAKHWLQWLDDVLDARWGAKRKTIITSNRNPDTIAEWLGMRLADRLNEGSIFGTREASMRGAAS